MTVLNDVKSVAQQWAGATRGLGGVLVAPVSNKNVSTAAKEAAQDVYAATANAYSIFMGLFLMRVLTKVYDDMASLPRRMGEGVVLGLGGYVVYTQLEGGLL